MAIFLDGKRFFSLSPDGKHLVSGGRDKAVTIWDVKSQGLIHQWPDLGEQVFDVAYSPDGRRVIACIRHNRKNRVIVWDANTHKEISNVRTDSGKAQFMPVISPDGKLVAYNHFKAPNFIWDIENRREHGWLKGHTGETRGIAFSGDSKYILTGGGDMTVRFWDVKTQEQLFSEQLDFSPMGVSLSADGRYGLVAAGEWYSGDGWHSDGHGDIRLYRLPIGE